MAYKMELWYRDPEGEFIKIDVKRWEVTGKTTMEIDAPLASNVIGDKKLADTRVEVVYN